MAPSQEVNVEVQRPKTPSGAWIFLATLMTAVAFIAIGWAVNQNSLRAQESRRISAQADRATCVRINGLDKLIQQQLKLSLQATPTLSYYRMHPAELRAQQKSTRAEIKAFAPQPCPTP